MAGLLAGCGRQSALPEPGSEAYREAVVAFHTSLAAMQSGEDLGADDYLHRVTQRAPGEPAAWANRGLLALRRNELNEAEAHLDRAVDLAPQSAEIRRLQAALYSQRGDFDAAVAALREAVRLQPDDPKTLYALVQALERQNAPGHVPARAELLDRLRDVVPGNEAILMERLRLAALQDDPQTVTRLLDVLRDRESEWPAEAQDLLASIQDASRSGDVSDVATQAAFLRNVLLQRPAFRRDLAEIQPAAAQVGDVLTHFLRLSPPQREAAPPDTALRFTRQAAGESSETARWHRVVWPGGDEPPVLAAYRSGRLHLGDQGLVGPGADHVSMAHGDLDFDYRADVVLAGSEGVRLYRQDSTGVFTDATGDLPASLVDQAYSGVWLADIDLEGDLDIVLGQRTGAAVVGRNNGDGTFTQQQPWSWAGGTTAFEWVDLDMDGDPDPAVLDAAGRLGVWSNERQSIFTAQDVPALPGTGRALHASDLDGDGTFELLALLDDGTIVAVERAEDATSEVAPLVQGPRPDDDGAAWITTADLDNNGSPDVLTTASGQSTAWLAGPGGLTRLPLPEDADVQAVADLDGDGLLDLVGLDAAGEPARWRTSGTQAYHWHQLRLRAAQARGDQRVNTFAYGARIELRSGLLYQQRTVSEPVVHVGLGPHEHADLMRIVWPNGDVQAEFDLAADQEIRTPQRLKGSCPWVFTYDGDQMRFVTDFIWRSPLGLRINAQETAGVMATGDWIRIRGDQLVPRDGRYDLRITAELWETHFFDYVALKVIDHPVDTEVLVDERFAFPPPPLALHTTAPLRPVAAARTGSGTDVTGVVRERDDRHVGTFALGQYQGVAREHVLDVDLGDDVPADSGVVLVATGWVRPTDSSINVALSQGDHAPPQGLQVEVPDGQGGWRVLHPNLGFPSGKDKTMLIPLDAAFASDEPRRVRLRTNLEVYWDRLAWTVRRDVQPTVRTLAPDTAHLDYRGFSEVVQPNRQTPERPVYDRLAGTAPRWMDLEGYYTRFGDVRPLLDEVDDRYVIMNAGDEMRFVFDAPPPPPRGWTRTFVLAGDGWVKDGDYNTAFSETVRPLPAHDRPDYSTPPTTLAEDPVYQRHPDDWRDYHTRYVAPNQFHRALRPDFALDSNR